MALSLSLINIKNSAHQLNALPVGESVFILFSAKPDLQSVNKHVALVRVDSTQQNPNPGETLNNQPGYLKEKYGTVPCDFSVTENAGQFSLLINPVELLVPNSNYYLVVDKLLYPSYAQIAKPVSLGQSAITVTTEDNAIALDAVYTIEIVTKSAISAGKHLVGYKLTRDAEVIETKGINVLTDSVKLNTGVFVKFDNTPLLVGEKFTITTQSFSRLGKDYAQPIKTAISPNVITKPESESTSVNDLDLIKFYEDNAFFTKAEEAPLVISIDSYLNKFIVKMPSNVDMATVNPLTLISSISYAFDNYLLTKMGLYDEAAKWKVTHSINGNEIEYIVVRDDTLVSSFEVV